jgi:glycosyltransferase involved in cell wall biosynthesis
MRVTNPRIAVIVPVLNGRRFLDDAMKCVESQQYCPLELVIVDDGSSDGSYEHALAAGVRVLQTPGLGPAAARNVGIRATDSDLIAFLDVDDLWPPGTLHRLAAALASNPDAGFAQGRIQNFRDDRGAKRFFTRPYRFINLGASLYRRSVFERVGLLDETMRLCEDVDFLMRCWENDIVRVPLEEVTLHYRRHPGNMTAGLQGAEFGTVQAYKRRLDRLRRGVYDPKTPRHIPAVEYMGTGPGRQDEWAS